MALWAWSEGVLECCGGVESSQGGTPNSQCGDWRIGPSQEVCELGPRPHDWPDSSQGASVSGDMAGVSNNRASAVSLNPGGVSRRRRFLRTRKELGMGWEEVPSACPASGRVPGRGAVLRPVRVCAQSCKVLILDVMGTRGGPPSGGGGVVRVEPL